MKHRYIDGLIIYIEIAFLKPFLFFPLAFFASPRLRLVGAVAYRGMVDESVSIDVPRQRGAALTQRFVH